MSPEVLRGQWCLENVVRWLAEWQGQFQHCMLDRPRRHLQLMFMQSVGASVQFFVIFLLKKEVVLRMIVMATEAVRRSWFKILKPTIFF